MASCPEQTPGRFTPESLHRGPGPHRPVSTTGMPQQSSGPLWAVPLSLRGTHSLIPQFPFPTASSHMASKYEATLFIQSKIPSYHVGILSLPASNIHLVTGVQFHFWLPLSLTFIFFQEWYPVSNSGCQAHLFTFLLISLSTWRRI